MIDLDQRWGISQCVGPSSFQFSAELATRLSREARVGGYRGFRGELRSVTHGGGKKHVVMVS